jgi:hypothetical protein
MRLSCHGGGVMHPWIKVSDEARLVWFLFPMFRHLGTLFRRTSPLMILSLSIQKSNEVAPVQACLVQARETLCSS